MPAMPVMDLSAGEPGDRPPLPSEGVAHRDGEQGDPSRARALSFVPIPVLLCLMVVVEFTVRPTAFYDPAWLVLAGNGVFVTGVSLIVSFVAARHYAGSGRLQVLLLGCGVLIFGTAGAVAAAVRGLPDGANLNVTIYNSGALLGAGFHFAAALCLLAGISPESGSARRRCWSWLAYAGALALVAVFSAACLRGAVPRFFVQGVGPTLLRQRVLGSADLLFLFSFLVFLGTYLRTREAFLYWYACALALTAISLTAFYVQRSVGSPVGWVGRCSQYLGGVYFLVSLITAARGAKVRGTSLDDVLTASLSGAEEKFRALAENAPDAIRRFDRKLNLIYVNPAGLRCHGLPAAAVVGRPIAEVFPGEQASGWRERVQEVFDTGAQVEVEEYADTAAGARFYQSRCVPERGPDGAVVNVLVLSRDLTERKQAEQALHESEQRVRQKLESILSPEGDIGQLKLADFFDVAALQSMMEELYRLARFPAFVLDLEGKLLVGAGWQRVCTSFHRAHPEARRHCVESDTELSSGIPPGEIRLYRCKNNMWDAVTPLVVGGHHVGNVFTGQFFFDDEPLDRDLFRAQAARFGFDEEGYLAALEAVPRLSRSSVAAGMSFLLKLTQMLSHLSYSNVKLARSVAERESLMKSLEESKALLEESDRRKSEFLAVLSHELRNPLAPIRNSLAVLDRAVPGSEQAVRAREIIRRQTDQLSRLVGDLLDVTRISQGKIELKRAPIDAREVVREACEDHRSLFEELRVQLRVEAADPVWIDADRARIAQVVGNLLQNAAKFSGEGGTVVASLAAVEGWAELRVRDDGVGIAPALLPQLFRPFVQGDAGLARTKGGLGLGLALVQSLVQLHGGVVSARSEGEGRGAEFIVRIPRRPAPGASAGAAGPAAAARSVRVLIVEDNADAAQSIADVLELAGHQALIAIDGRSGIAKARELAPEVVICDIGLPDMDGYEVARTLRAERTATRLIALTGYAQPEDRRRAKDAGFDDHLPKPPPLERLLDLIASAAAG